MNNINLDFKEIMRTVENQFNDIIYKDSFYNGYFVTVAEEQDFNRILDKSPNHIYIVVKFLSASINFGQVLLPITITAVSEDRKLDVCKKLLFEYADRNNLILSNDETIKQFYTSPQVISNFEEIYDGYRSLFTLSGTFLINRNANPYKYYLNVIKLDLSKVNFLENVKIDEEKFYKTIVSKGLQLKGNHGFSYSPLVGYWVYGYDFDEVSIKNKKWHPNEFGITFDGNENDFNSIDIIVIEEEIKNLNNRSNFDIQHDSQLFFNSNNNVRSRAKSKVNVISFSTYLLDTEFVNRAIAISLDDYSITPEGENTSFIITKEYKSGLKGTRIYKLASVSEESSVSEFPLINITLTI